MTLTQVETPQAPESDAFELTQNLSSLYQLAKTRKQQYIAQWRKNWLLVMNRMGSADSPQWGANVMDSEIFPILSSRIAWLLDQKLYFDVAPAAAPGSPWTDHMTRLGQDLEQILETNYQLNEWDLAVVLAAWDSALFGAGILKSVWDAGSNAGLGDARLIRVDPWKFYPDPNCTSLDDGEYFFEVKKMTIAQIERMFPSAVERVLEQARQEGETTSDSEGRPSPTWSSTLPMADPGLLPGGAGPVGLPGQGRLHSTSDLLENGVVVYECWLRENYRDDRQTTDPSHGEIEDVVSDQWRVVVYTGNVVLLDELAVNLWEEERHPYVRFVDEEMGEFWPTPITSHLAPCQIAINRLLSSIQGNAELVGNPIFMDVENSGIARTAINNRPGVRLTKSPQTANSSNAQPDWMRPPEMPSYVLNTVQFWISRMENISGLSGPQKGQPTSGRQAQQTVQATQEAGFVRIRSALRNLERCLGSAGNLLANLIIQNYDVPRVVSIVGDDGVDTALRLAGNHFYMPTKNKQGKVIKDPLKFSLVVKAGSSSPTSRQARIAEADALFAMGAIDKQAVLQAHSFRDWQGVVARMQKEAQAQAFAQGQGAGKTNNQPRGPGTGHPH